jgi:hypothetical protein
MACIHFTGEGTSSHPVENRIEIRRWRVAQVSNGWIRHEGRSAPHHADTSLFHAMEGGDTYRGSITMDSDSTNDHTAE